MNPSSVRHAALAAAFALALVAALSGAAQAQEMPVAPATPVLGYGSYLGGSSSDRADAVAIGANGDLYVLGETYSEDLFGSDLSLAGYSDLFVAHFDAAGHELIWLAVIGSDDTDTPCAIGVDAHGNVYATAIVYNNTFPTKDALWPTQAQSTDGVLFKLDGQGQLVYSTYLPLELFDVRKNLAVDAAGNAFVTGTVRDVWEGDLYLGNQIGLLKISPNGQTLLMERQIGRRNDDSARAVTLDADGRIYLAGITESPNTQPGNTDFPVTSNARQLQCGDILYEGAEYCEQDGVIVVLDGDGAVTYASYHGGSAADDPKAIAADGHGMVWVVGETHSTRFPLSHALQSACPPDETIDHCYSPYGFISAMRVQSPKAVLVYSTYLGSTERESWTLVTAAAADGVGNLYVTGHTDGKHILVKDALQPELTEGICGGSAERATERATENKADAVAVRFCYDGFVVKLTPTGALAFGSYLGGTEDEYLYSVSTAGAAGPVGAVYVVGLSDALDFTTTPTGFQPQPPLPRNGVLVRIDTGGGGQTVEVSLPPDGPGGRVVVQVLSTPDGTAVQPAGSYPLGTVLRLTALPGPGYRFGEWGGDLSGSANPAQVTVSGPLTISAQFTQFAHRCWLPSVGK